jgi:hypothetical protein
VINRGNGRATIFHKAQDYFGLRLFQTFQEPALSSIEGFNRYPSTRFVRSGQAFRLKPCGSSTFKSSNPPFDLFNAFIPPRENPWRRVHILKGFHRFRFQVFCNCEPNIGNVKGRSRISSPDETEERTQGINWRCSDCGSRRKLLVRLPR